jgi:hypothetical protein
MIGDEGDFLSRLQSTVPVSWFSGSANNEPAALTGIANLDAFIYGLLVYVKKQTRIKTATDGWLDLIAYDFFGLTVQRAPGQSDAGFVVTILAAIFRQRNTRNAIISVLTDLTGSAPIVFSPWRDGSYNDGQAYYGVSLYGDPTMPFQTFVIAYRGRGLTDAQIYAAIDSVRMAGTKLWVRIVDPAGYAPDFILDTSTLGGSATI